MKFTGNADIMFSARHSRFVMVLDYKSDSGAAYTECSRCGGGIKHTMCVIQDPETGISMERLCAACAKRI